MALRTTGMTTTLIGNTIGNNSRDVETLCTAPTINPWSKARPGYWKAIQDSNSKWVMAYQPPRGAGNTDPRGANPETGDTEEGYRLGDFRGYNHTAETPTANAYDQTLDPSAANSAQSVNVAFYFKEYNWLNSVPYRTQNGLFQTQTDPAVILRKPDGTIMGWAAIPASPDGQYITIAYNYTAGNVGSTTSYDYEIWIGNATSASQTPIYAVADASGNIMTGSFSVHVEQNPSVAVNGNSPIVISANSGSVSQGSTALSYTFHVDSGVGATATAVTADLYKNTVKIDTQTIYTKDGDTYNGTFTLATAADYDENYVIQLSL
jgi:hypothetical protein